MMKFLFLISLVFGSFSAYAYPNFIGHGYTSCLNCHFNPFGGGPLNDYGRAVGATLISRGDLYPSDWSEEKVAYTSGFLFRKPKQNWLRTQINYRGFRLVQNPGSSSSENARWINMQADARVILKFGENDKAIAVVNYGYAAVNPENEALAKEDKYRSREHYVGYKFSPNFGLYAGLMDKVHGIRVIEHIAFSRDFPQITQNDQVHGVVGHFLGEKWEGGLHGFVGNMSQDDDLRVKGGSFMVERSVGENSHRIGLSGQKASNEYLDLMSYAGHGRFNLKDGSAVLAEVGQVVKKGQSSADPITSRYGLLQTYMRPTRGVYFFTNIEYAAQNIENDAYAVRWGPGVQYFPVQRIELRFDIYNTRNFAKESSSPDSWQYLMQAHLWL